jgi:hypothetical protein
MQANTSTPSPRKKIPDRENITAMSPNVLY